MAGLVAEYLPGAVDGQQGAELADLAPQLDLGKTSASRPTDGRFMTVFAAAMMKLGLPATTSRAH